MTNLLCFGMGFCAQALAERLMYKSWNVVGTSRSPERVFKLVQQGLNATVLDEVVNSKIMQSDPLHVLISVPPDEQGDPILRTFGDKLRRRAPQIRWLGYLSTTGVYGDQQGEWVDENSPTNAVSTRAIRRLKAESQWLAFGTDTGVPVHVFRLAGIYGPGRNQLETIISGTARRIVKKGQVFSRIHVDDVATVLEASMLSKNSGRVYNVCDDEPCAPDEVVAFAANLLNIPPLPREDFATAKATMSAMAASFYEDSKRVRNDRIKSELSVALKYPTYKEGLKALQVSRSSLQAK